LWRRVLRPRVLVYATILLAASIALVGHMATRNPVKLDVIRDRGALAREVEDGMIENVYRLQIMNSSEESRSYVLSVSGLETVFIDSDTEVEVGAAGNRLVPVRVRIQPGIGEPGTHTIYFGVTDRDNPAVSVSEKTTFYVPLPRYAGPRRAAEMQSTSPEQTPWWRQLWPWFLISLPACAVIASLVTLWLAMDSADSLVVDDYYREGRAINRTIARDARATELG